MKAIVTIGVSASGKSTWARKFAEERLENEEVWAIIERDEARLKVLKEKKPQYDLDHVDWSKWNWKWEKEVTDLQWEYINDCVGLGINVIISDTNLNHGRLKELKANLLKLGFEDVLEKVFEVDFTEAVKRDSKRAATVGFSVIAKQLENFHEMMVPQYKGTQDAPKAVMVDVDGTLAEMSATRGPFDWDRVHEDSVKEEVRDVVKGLHLLGYIVVILSGRDGSCRDKTVKWLFDNDIPFDNIFMRQAGDMRKDSIIKSEIFWENVAPNYDVKMVIDDRPQVTRMWRSIGLNVLQVGNPYVEF